MHHTYLHQEASYIHKSWKRCIVTCIIHSGSRTRIIDATYIHARFRIKGQDHCFVHHTRMYLDQAFVRPSVGDKISAASYTHHTHMQHSQVSRITDVCILLLESPCSFVGPLVPNKYRIIYTYTSPDSCIIRIMEQNHRFVHCASYICASYIHASG
mgnify:CR=1 FL=1